MNVVEKIKWMAESEILEYWSSSDIVNFFGDEVLSSLLHLAETLEEELIRPKFISKQDLIKHLLELLDNIFPEIPKED